MVGYLHNDLSKQTIIYDIEASPFDFIKFMSLLPKAEVPDTLKRISVFLECHIHVSMLYCEHKYPNLDDMFEWVE